MKKECNGHPDDGSSMGQTMYCDGSCRKPAKPVGYAAFEVGTICTVANCDWRVIILQRPAVNHYKYQIISGKYDGKVITNAPRCQLKAIKHSCERY